jgi:hypothetical protein
MHSIHGNTPRAAPRAQNGGKTKAVSKKEVSKAPPKATRAPTLSTKDSLHLIGCYNDHQGQSYMVTGNSSQDRRCYQCKKCNVRYTQKSPQCMISEGVGYADRRPTPVNRRARPGPAVGDGPKAPSQTQATNVGDITLRFHSSDGISSCETKRMRYFRMHMQRADALGGSESGFKDNEVDDIADKLKWDHEINATLFHAGYHRRQTGYTYYCPRNRTSLRQRAATRYRARLPSSSS